MALTIYHNPRCSKSRQTLELINNAGIQPNIVQYLADAPDADTLLDLSKKLEKPLADLLRKGETVFKEASDLPPLEDSGRAVVGRPPENVLALLP